MKTIRCNTNEIHKNTYGDSQCAIDLADILTKLNNKGTTKKVGAILQGFYSGLSDLDNLKTHRETFIKLWLTKFKGRVLNNKLPRDVETRVLNIIVAKYRKAMNK